MDKNIINYLKAFNLSDLEIADMLTCAPLIDVANYEEFILNCDLLEKYGYPKADLDVLFTANPNIFVLSSKKLESKLQRLQDEFDNIEDVLKNNPLII